MGAGSRYERSATVEIIFRNSVTLVAKKGERLYEFRSGKFCGDSTFTQKVITYRPATRGKLRRRSSIVSKSLCTVLLVLLQQSYLRAPRAV